MDKQQLRNRWSLNEIAIVANKAVELLAAKYRESDLFPSVDSISARDMTDAAMRAQRLALPRHRQKEAFGQSVRGSLEERIRTGMRLVIAEEAKRKAELKPVQPAQLELPKPETPAIAAPQAPAAERRDSPPGSPVGAAPDLLAQLGMQLGEALGAAIAREIVKGLQGALSGELLLNAMKEQAKEVKPVMPPPAPVVKIEQPQEEERPRRPRVAVIGLLPEQRHQISQKFPNVDFRFLDNAAGGDRVGPVTEHCDAAVVMTKFCSHSVHHKIKARQRLMVNGGMTDLAHVLRGRFGEPASARAAA